MTEIDDTRNNARRYGRTLGDMFAQLTGDYETNFDAWEAAQARRRRQQAQARKDYGLAPAPFVESGCEGEPQPRDTS